MIQMLKFYLFFGKATLPRWYAHNPLCLPIYLVFLVLMVLAAFTGHLQGSYPIVFGIVLPSLHAGIATFISLFVLGHVIAVFMHDLKGGGDDMSAMINGNRLFEVKPMPTQEIGDVHRVFLDSLKSGLKNPPHQAPERTIRTTDAVSHCALRPLRFRSAHKTLGMFDMVASPAAPLRRLSDADVSGAGCKGHA